MIAIIDYGLGNLANVKNAFDKIGVGAVITDDKGQIEAADRLIFPGVGAAAAGMEKLHKSGLGNLIVKESAKNKPVLGICLGMQLLFQKSEEGNVDCLKILDGDVNKFVVPGLKVPHVGWNNVVFDNCLLFRNIPMNSYFYFVHSFYCNPNDSQIIVGKTDYGGRFCSAVEKKNIFGVQFHPEKSGDAGLQLLKNFSEI